MVANKPISALFVLDQLIEICGSQYVFTDKEDLYNYGRDQTLALGFSFDALVKPGTVEEISSIMKLCFEHRIPVTPRGGGSGVTGGALPVAGGIVLALERLNKIVCVNTVDSYVIAEAGVVTEDLCSALEEYKMFFPAAPSSSSCSFVGGNVAQNSGSIRSCKYGTAEKLVLNLEVVLSDGSVIWTGANVLKNSTGLNFTQLFVGSEGVLGIITKVVLKLLPEPKHQTLLLAAFSSLEAALKVVVELKNTTLTPSSMELVCEEAMRITANYLDGTFPFTTEKIKAHLLIEFSEFEDKNLSDSIERMAAIIANFTHEEVLVATSASEKERLWKLRMTIGAALTQKNNKYRDIDICMPLSRLYDYILKVETVCRDLGLRVACFGHVLDGNLHTMLLYEPDVNEEQINKAAKEIYTYAILKGGVISGEHGIGLIQKDFMTQQFSIAHLNLMKSIKMSFDPRAILNPGKFV